MSKNVAMTACWIAPRSDWSQWMRNILPTLRQLALLQGTFSNRKACWPLGDEEREKEQMIIYTFNSDSGGRRDVRVISWSSHDSSIPDHTSIDPVHFNMIIWYYLKHCEQFFLCRLWVWFTVLLSWRLSRWTINSDLFELAFHNKMTFVAVHSRYIQARKWAAILLINLLPLTLSRSSL